jgi:hypothetical protein
VEAGKAAWVPPYAMGAMVKDPGEGLIDFYGRIDGKLVCLRSRR